MASGLPIVTTPCEGVAELIADNGIVVEQAEPGAIAEAIVKLTVEPRRYEDMSQAARRRAGEFTWAATAERYIRCYERILST